MFSVRGFTYKRSVWPWILCLGLCVVVVRDGSLISHKKIFGRGVSILTNDFFSSLNCGHQVFCEVDSIKLKECFTSHVEEAPLSLILCFLCRCWILHWSGSKFGEQRAVVCVCDNEIRYTDAIYFTAKSESNLRRKELLSLDSRRMSKIKSTDYLEFELICSPLSASSTSQQQPPVFPSINRTASFLRVDPGYFHHRLDKRLNIVVDDR